MNPAVMPAAKAFSLGITGRKLALGIVLPLLAIAFGPALGFKSGEIGLVAFGIIAGMLFPDLDIITGWIRTTFHTMLLILFMIVAILIFPFLWNSASPFCPAADFSKILPSIDPLVLCKVVVAVAMMAASWVLSMLLVSWVPAKNSFHQWTTLVFVAGSVGMLNQVLATATEPWFLTGGFALGYAAHILCDYPPFPMFMQKKGANESK